MPTRCGLAGGRRHRGVRRRHRRLRLCHTARPVVVGRTLSWALLALIVFGLVTIWVAIPIDNIIHAVAGLGIFGAFTIVDINPLRRASHDNAIEIAASIFLDIFNVFLLALDLFGSQRDRSPPGARVEGRADEDGLLARRRRARRQSARAPSMWMGRHDRRHQRGCAVPSGWIDAASQS
jgi:hypothetical protein